MAAAVIVILSACVPSVAVSESVQETVKLETPAPLGVPLVVATEIESPAGSDPTSPYRHREIPPVIDSVSEYAEPVTPPGSVVVVMSIGRHPQQQPTQSQSRRLSSRPSCRWLRQPRKRKPAFRQAAHRKSPARALPRSTGPFPSSSRPARKLWWPALPERTSSPQRCGRQPNARRSNWNRDCNSVWVSAISDVPATTRLLLMISSPVAEKLHVEPLSTEGQIRRRAGSSGPLESWPWIRPSAFNGKVPIGVGLDGSAKGNRTPI